MVYKVIGLMSGSSLDGLDIAYCSIEEIGGSWAYEIVHADCAKFPNEWKQKLSEITKKDLPSFFKIHTSFGKWMGTEVNAFIEKYQLHHKVNLIASHGHTAMHFPKDATTVQIGCGASIAATTGIATVSDLRAMDMAFGGQGAPIVPIAEQLLFPNYKLLLNIGGICNISLMGETRSAFDIAPANRVLNEIVLELNIPFDNNGDNAAKGQVQLELLEQLNALPYYSMPAPKSLANEFGLHTILPLINESNLSVYDKLCTMCEHIAQQIEKAIPETFAGEELLITGGGALNNYLISRIEFYLAHKKVKVHIPDHQTIEYKEALAMALIGVLRWREEVNVLASATGAQQDSIGGALWMV